MVRPRSFDHEAVVDAAQVLFWRKGYGSTSVQDLVEATGLERGSLYGAFGSKAGLFEAALTKYMDERRALVAKAPSGEALLRGWFAFLIDQAVAQDPGRGCLLLNSANHLPALPQELREMVGAHVELIEGVYRQALAEALGLPKAHPVIDQRARQLLASLIGIATLSRLGYGRAPLQEIAAQALGSALEAPS